LFDDQKSLRDLNLEIGHAENRGDVIWLSEILAPRLAFQRADANQTVDDHVAFLQKVQAGQRRPTQVLEPIKVYGNRAVVECLVTVNNDAFHNLRLFVRRHGQWKLLGWANEPT